MSKDTTRPTIMMPSRSVPPTGSTGVDSYQPRPPSGTMVALSLLTTPTTQRERIVPGSTASSAVLEELRKSPACRLEIERRAAAGGMGTIDVAVDRALDRRIAVKTLHSHLRGDDAAVRMFLREARLTGLLDHPHIVPVYDVGERDGESLYFSMKLVEGQTLAAIISALPRGPLDGAMLFTLLDVVTKVCDALAFAHSRGVIHCDVKPANVMVGEFGQVYLMDWGIARLIATEAAPGSTADFARVEALRSSATDNSVIGTTSYMSPEQARGDRGGLDARSDVFLLGALLYEILTRRPPYAAHDRGEALARAVASKFTPPRSEAGDPSIPLELERIVLRAMAKAPADRYAEVSELRDDIVRFMRGGADYPRRTFSAGSVIVREGENGDAAYILVSGKCEVWKASSLGVQVVETFGPGDVFGEMAVLSEGPRTATVVAVEETVALVVTAAALEQEMSAIKPWMAKLMKSLAARFRNVDAAQRASSSPAPPAVSPARVASQILMHLNTWGDESDGGGRSAPLGPIARELEAAFGWPPLAIFGAASRYGISIDTDADRLRIDDPKALAARLRAELDR